MSGWIKLHKSLLDWEWWDDHNTTRLLIYLLVAVNYEPKKWKGMVINPGQLITSWGHLSNATGLTVQQLRTSMDKLISNKQVNRQTTNKFQVLTLMKWDELQNEKEKKESEATNNLTDQQQANNKQITTTKESKEYKEEQERKKKELNILNKSLLSEIKISDVPENEKDYFEISIAFLELFKRNSELLKVKWINLDTPTYKNWIPHIRLMFEADKRNKDDLIEIYHFLQKDEFWMQQIQSPKNLRKHFEKLSMNAKKSKNGRNTEKRGSSTVSDEYLRRLREDMESPDEPQNT